MGKIFFILIIVSVSITNKSFAQTDTSIYNSISKLDLDHYASLPVDSFLKVIPQTYNEIGIYGDLGPNDNAKGLVIRYENGLVILVKPKKYLFMIRSGHNNWDLSFFKKETSSSIIVIPAEGKAIYGIYP